MRNRTNWCHLARWGLIVIAAGATPLGERVARADAIGVCASVDCAANVLFDPGGRQSAGLGAPGCVGGAVVLPPFTARHSETGTLFNPNIVFYTEVQGNASGSVSGFQLGEAVSSVTMLGSAQARVTDLVIVPGVFGSIRTVLADFIVGTTANFKVNNTTPAEVTVTVNGGGSVLAGGRFLAAGTHVFDVEPGIFQASMSVNAGFFYPDILDLSAPAPNYSRNGSVTLKFKPKSAARLRALEVTQAVQDWRNSVPLIAGKRTFVRAFLEAANSSQIGEGVAGVLHGSRNGQALPGSPLAPDNPNGMGYLAVDSADLTERIPGDPPWSLHFELPPSWTSDRIELRLAVPEAYLLCALPAQPGLDASACKVEVEFEPSPTLAVKILRVAATLPETGSIYQPSEADVDQAVAEVGNFFPIDAMVYDTGEFYATAQDMASFEALNERLAMLQLEEGNPAFPVYYGLLTGPFLDPTILGQAQGAPSSIASGRADAGPRVISHELGHVVGRDHPVDYSLGEFIKDGVVGWRGHCNEWAPAQAEPFPYFVTQSGEIRPAIGPMDQGDDALIFQTLANAGSGFQVRSPYVTADLMSNCGMTPSKYTYEGILAGIRFQGPAALSPAAARGLPPEDYLVVRGLLNLETDEVLWQPFCGVTLDQFPPTPLPGIYSIETLDDDDGVLDSVPISLPPVADSRSAQVSFRVLVPAAPAARLVRIWRGQTLLAQQQASATPPTVQVLTPNGGDTFAGPSAQFAWQASDADGDRLSFNVSYSPDAGATWSTLAIDWPDTSITVSRSALKGGGQGRLRVSVSDGFLFATDVSDDPFTVANHPPRIAIASPGPGARFHYPQPILLRASVYDTEDGAAGVHDVTWRSNRDGALGVGNTLFLAADELSLGEHEIMAVATDRSGQANAATRRITVRPFPPPRLGMTGPVRNGVATLRVTASAPSRTVLEVSSNLVDWLDRRSITQNTSTAYVTETVEAGARFYRARSEAPTTTILQQPSGVTRLGGADVQLSIEASGVFLSYQWYFKDIALSGATGPTLLLANAQPAQSGLYFCVVSNFAGAVASEAAQVSVLASPFQVLHAFGPSTTQGINGWGPLVASINGLIFGCSRNGGPNGGGSLFRYDTVNSNYTALRHFEPASDGAFPAGGVIEASDGRLFGTCQNGGANNSGTLWRINPDGLDFTVLHHFLSASDCRNPQSELIEADDGFLYGAAYNGGGFGRGGVFRLRTDGGDYSIVTGFGAAGTDSPRQPMGGLIQGLDGFLYGTSEFGGLSNKGCVFQLSSSGSYTVLKSLGLVEGGAENPNGTLAFTGGGLAGTAANGGVNGFGAIFSLATDGGFFNVRHHFGGAADDGLNPTVGMVRTPSGSFIGATRLGGTANQGTLFRWDNAGTNPPEILHHFTGSAGDGARPRAPLVFGGDGWYYGTTFGGGTDDQGVLFRYFAPDLDL